MKFVSDFLPVLCFFAVYFIGQRNAEAAYGLANDLLGGLTRNGVVPADLAPIMLATAIAIVVIGVQIVVALSRRKRVGAIQWITFLIFVIFGGATIYFHNDNFIKWKPTVLYWLFALALFVSAVFFKRNLIRQLMEANGMKLPTPVWQKLNLAWIVFFVAVGILNLYIAFYFSRDVWVSFKAFGMTGLTLVFAVVQAVFLTKHMHDVPEPEVSPEAHPAANLPREA